MRVDFINLDRSPDRLGEFKAVNSHLTELERFPAVDGQTLDIASLAQQGLVAPDILTTYTPGAVGVAMSHRALWQAAVDRGQMTTVAEDDVIFHSQFETLSAAVINSLPANWDLIFWGWNFDVMIIIDMLPGVSPCVAQFDQNKMRLHTREFQQLPLSPSAQKLMWSFGMTCYTVSPKGAQTLKNKCFPLRPSLIPWPEGMPNQGQSTGIRNMGIDAAMNGLYRTMNAYVCFPPLVISKNEHAKSTIQRGGIGTVAAAPSPPQGPPPAFVVKDVTAEMASPAAAVTREDIAALNNRGVELYKLNRREEALAQFEKALSLKPDDIVALSSRGNILFDLGRFDAALANCDRLLLLRPNEAHALNMRGLVLEALRRPEEALASYDRAVTVAPGAVEALYNRGNILADLSRFEEALASYDKALIIVPDAAPILNNRGLVLEELKRFEDALASYDRALKIKPDYGAAANNRRLVLEELERSRGAAAKPQA